jgi:prepilin-type N-terminal cleavage/methylation domain-containing protein
MPDKKGFTLIEIIVVIVIIGILISISVPAYFSMMQRGAANAAEHNLITIYNAEKSYFFANGVYCTQTTGASGHIPCTDTTNALTLLNTNLATLDQANPPATTLNITDNYFSYSCSTDTSGFKCIATNTGSGVILTLTNAPIVLPGSTCTPQPSCLNPSCNSNSNCPTS